MHAIILKHKDTYLRYPYAQYMEGWVKDSFCKQGGEVLLWEENTTPPSPSSKPVLYEVNVPTGNALEQAFWAKIQWPKLVKVLQPHWIFYMEATLPMLQNKSFAQWLLLPSLGYLGLEGKKTGKQARLEKLWNKNIATAQRVFTYSTTAKKSFETILPSSLADKVEVLVPFPDVACKPLDWEAMALVKEKLSAGEEYFLLDVSSCSVAEVMHHLKAFLHFKKWQKSAMKLILLLTEDLKNNAPFQEMLSSFYFRNDVHLLTNVPKQDYNSLLASAYGYLLLTAADDYLQQLLSAAQSGTLLMAYVSPSAKEWLGDTIFEVPGKGFADIGQLLIAAYKSENLRTKHIKIGLAAATNFDFAHTQEMLKRLLQQA